VVYARAAMVPPDVSRLLDLEAPAWRALADRLRALGIDGERVRPFARLGGRIVEPTRRALRAYHLRKMREPAAYAMRLWMFRDTVDAAEARAALGDSIPVERLLEVGLLAREADGSLRCPFFVNIANDLFVMCDDLSECDGVMGLGHTTEDICRASMPAGEVGSVLEVGCGAAMALLLCSSRARRAVGVDIDPRAVVIARANVLLNGLSNVEIRQGDLFEPVRGEQFDLIVAQPPFVAQPPGDSAVTWMHGGSRGDELPLRLIRDLPGHLTPGGRGVVLVEWPVFDADARPLEKRVRDAVPHDDVGVLLACSPGTDLDEHCVAYATGQAPFVGPEVERRMLARRRHLDEMGVRGLRLTVNVLQRIAAGRAWTARIDSRPFTEVGVTSSRVDKLVAAQELLGSDAAAFRGARLQVPEETRFSEEDDGVLAELPDDALVAPIRLNVHAARLVVRFTDAKTVDEVVAEAAPDADDDLRDKIRGAIRQALTSGLLEVVA
jgi:methylase of polypeptide subunit release factors